MLTRLLGSAALLAALTLAGCQSGSGSSSSSSQPSKSDKPVTEMSEADIQAAWMAAAAPGERHRQMAQIVGEWDTHVKYWMDPSAPPGESRGTMVSKPIFDGRFIQSDYSGDMDGMPFQGQALWGYNNVSKKFEGTWVDNMSTGVMFTEGTCDRAGKVFTSTWTAWDALSGQKKTGREVVTIIDADSHRMQMYDRGPDGKEFKSMEITYVRKGASAPR
jgi:hypothetical protein